MKNKGFTLVELLMTLVILGIVSTITIHVGIEMINESKEKERQVLVDNIKTAVDNLIIDCDYTEDDNNACNNLINNKTVNISELIDYGYLTTNDRNDEKELDIKDPVSGEWIRSCVFTYEDGIYTLQEGVEFCDLLETLE